MPHVTIIISSASASHEASSEKGVGHDGEAKSAVTANTCSYTVPHNMTDAEVGRDIAKLLRQIRKLGS